MYLNNLQHDDVFVTSKMTPLQDLIGMPSRRGLEQAIISNGKIVNIVSNSYGHMPNEEFFTKAEQLVVDSNLHYQKQTINRNDRSFIMDVIIEDTDQFSTNDKDDKILPMLRFKNSYDGSEKTSGHFGFYRKVCSNGLHVSETKLAFSIRHGKNSAHLVMPKLNRLLERFLDNEFYSIVNKFDAMKSIEIMDTEAFVKDILERTKLFRYECSDKNDSPSKKSREVIEILSHEAILLNEAPNLWLGYNAFNAVLHRTLKKTFSQQKKPDKVLFNEISNMV